MLVLEQFLRMVNSDVKPWIKEHNPKSAKKAVVLAESFIAARRDFGHYQMAGGKESQAAWPGKSEGGRDGGQRNKSPRTFGVSPEGIVCYYCGQAGHMNLECPRRKPKDAQVAFIPKTSKEAGSGGYGK